MCSSATRSMLHSLLIRARVTMTQHTVRRTLDLCAFHQGCFLQHEPGADLALLRLYRHVLEVHRAATQRREVVEEEAREEAFFKRYLEFCRARVAPRLSEPAADSLVSQYVELREQVMITFNPLDHSH